MRQDSGARNSITSPRRGPARVYAKVLMSAVSPMSRVCSIASDGIANASCPAKYAANVASGAAPHSASRLAPHIEFPPL